MLIFSARFGRRPCGCPRVTHRKGSAPTGLWHSLSLNSGVEGIRESVYTKCKGETERGGKLSAPLHKACYDRRMKIKRGRQILSAAQENPDG